MTKTRIYAVDDGVTARLVRAPNAAQAINHVVRGRYTAAPATQDQLVKLIADGVEVEDASTTKE